MNYATAVKDIIENPLLLEKAHKGALERAKTLMRKEDYMKQLEEIYNHHISSNNKL